MELTQSLEALTENLKSAGVGHALIGGFALAAYGVARATIDIDFLVDGRHRENLRATLQRLSYKIVHETPEVLQANGPCQADFLFANRPMALEMLRNARSVSEFPTRVLRAEDIIGLKIQAYCNDASREFQDKADIQSLIKNVTTLDFDLIKKYADLFGQWETIQDIRRKV